MTLNEWIAKLEDMRRIHGGDATLWVDSPGGLPGFRYESTERPAEIVLQPLWLRHSTVTIELKSVKL